MILQKVATCINQGQELEQVKLYFENVNYERQLNDGNCTGTIR